MLQHTNPVAVFVAEERERTGCDGVVVCEHTRISRRVVADLGVHERLDLAQLLRRHRLEMSEVETQPVGRHERAFLLHMRAQHLAQRRVQQVRGRMVQYDRRAAFGIDLGGNAVADCDASHRDLADVAEGCAELLGIADREARGPGAKLTRIAHLPAALRIKRSAFQHHGARYARLERLHSVPLCVEQRHDGRVALE